MKKRTDCILLIARHSSSKVKSATPHSVSLVSFLSGRRCPPFFFHSARSQAARDKARATHQAERRAPGPRYVEISADLSSKLDRVLPPWGPSRVVRLSAAEEQ